MAWKLRKLRFLQISLKTILFPTMVIQYSHITMKHACRLKLTRHLFRTFLSHIFIFLNHRADRNEIKLWW